jgi:hypothetical protein
MFKNRVAPGSLYAALRAASAERRPRQHGRSRSEERIQTQTQLGSVLLTPAQTRRTRPQSMLPPSKPGVLYDFVLVDDKGSGVAKESEDI